jgi:hypothetical protein
MQVTLPTSLVAIICLAGLPGCRSASERLPYARDPLLLARRPVQGTAGTEPPISLAFGEPQPPVLPATAYVALPPASRIAPQPPMLLTDAPSRQPGEPAKFALASEKPVLATLMPRVKSSSPVQAIPVSRTRSSPIFGRAADFSWLQGVLERSESGQWQLRYTNQPEDDPWDGKVNLEDHPSLAALRAGAAVEVEGAIVSMPSDTLALPTYCIRRLAPQAATRLQNGVTGNDS